jgi:hypothetical protein
VIDRDVRGDDERAGSDPAADDPVVEYVVVGPALEEADPARFAALFQAFVDGYGRHFSGDEAEPTTAWLDRMTGKPRPQPVMRIIVAVEHESGAERVVGGVAAEYYRDARCILVSYLYVEDQKRLRHRGHGRALLREAEHACQTLGPVQAVFAEVEWPELLFAAQPGADLRQARGRLHFFARVGARVLNLDYVQPALDPAKRPVPYLRLLVLSSAFGLRRDGYDRLAAAVRGFLREFYAALSEETDGQPDHETLAILLAQTARRPLTMPLPALRAHDAGVCLHFVDTLDVASADDRDVVEFVRTSTCPVLHSMESDLLSRMHRAARVFRTVCLTKALDDEPAERDQGVKVEIEFPARLTFRSENRTEERWWPLRRRAARAYLALTLFLDTGAMVWHLTLRPAAPGSSEDTDWFDELDLVSLLRLAADGIDPERVRIPGAGGGAETSLIDGLRFIVAGAPPGRRDARGLLEAVAAITHARFKNPLPRATSAPVAATVQLLGANVRTSEDVVAIQDARERNAVCGMVTGILDFDEIDEAEARDTLTPSAELDDALLTVHRESLVYVAEADRAARTTQRTVGVSPYLIVPFAVVLHDEWLLNRLPPAPRPPADARTLARTITAIEDTLHIKWIANPFFYPTERTLYEAALVSRGVAARRAEAEALLLQLKTRLQLARDAMRERFEADQQRFEAIVTALLGGISIVAIDPLIADVGSRWGLESWVAHLATVLAAVAVFVVVYRLKRPTPRAEDEAA